MDGWTQAQITECLQSLSDIKDLLSEIAPWVVASAFAGAVIGGILVFRMVVHGKERRRVW